MKYEFHVGDYVETKNDARGYVGDVDEMIWQCTQSSNDYMYAAGYTYHIPVEELNDCFNRIGQYDFTKPEVKKIEHFEYNYPCSEIRLTAKINELVDAVNELRKERT